MTGQQNFGQQRMKKLFKTFSLISIFMLTSCTLVPGMHMNSRDFTPSINAKGQTQAPTLTPINAQLIVKQRRQAKWQAEQIAINYHQPKGFSSNVANYRYRLGPQDILNIQIWNHPAFSTQSQAGSSGNSNSNNIGITVNAEGKIFYPYVGELKVTGLSTEQVRSLLTKKLSTYLKDPQISVSVVGFNSQVVDITGAVANPTLIPLTNVPLTVLSAVSKAGNAIPCSKAAGGSGSCADIGHVVVTHNGISSKINLDTLKAPNGSSTNWVLHQGDKIYVPNNSSYVFLLGAAKSTGTFNMIDGKLSLKELIGSAGGMGPGSDPTYTYVIRNFKNHPKIFVMNLRSPDSLNLAGQFALKPEDVVFVSTSKIQSFNEIINQFTPSLSTVAYIRSLDR